MEEITRHIDWNVSFWMLAFLYAGSFLAFGVSGFRLYRRVRVWKAGRPYPVETSLARALSNVIAWAVNRSKMPRDRIRSVDAFADVVGISSSSSSGPRWSSWNTKRRFTFTTELSI